MTTITQEEYGAELAAYITEQMAHIPPDTPKNLSFWADFNRQKKIEFDAKLANDGVTVETVSL